MFQGDLDNAATVPLGVETEVVASRSNVGPTWLQMPFSSHHRTN